MNVLDDGKERLAFWIKDEYVMRKGGKAVISISHPAMCKGNYLYLTTRYSCAA